MHIKCRGMSPVPESSVSEPEYYLGLFLINGTDRFLDILPGQLVCAE